MLANAVWMKTIDIAHRDEGMLTIEPTTSTSISVADFTSAALHRIGELSFPKFHVNNALGRSLMVQANPSSPRKRPAVQHYQRRTTPNPD